MYNDKIMNDGVNDLNRKGIKVKEVLDVSQRSGWVIELPDNGKPI